MCDLSRYSHLLLRILHCISARRQNDCFLRDFFLRICIQNTYEKPVHPCMQNSKARCLNVFSGKFQAVWKHQYSFQFTSIERLVSKDTWILRSGFPRGWSVDQSHCGMRESDGISTGDGLTLGLTSCPSTVGIAQSSGVTCSQKKHTHSSLSFWQFSLLSLLIFECISWPKDFLIV